MHFGGKILLVLGLAMLNIDESLEMKRPDQFDSKIMGSLKTKKFFTKKTDTKKKSTKAKINNRGISFHLAHVFPWSAIDVCVSGLWANKNQLNQFIDVIFRVDPNAVTYEKWDKASILNPITQTMISG